MTGDKLVVGKRYYFDETKGASGVFIGYDDSQYEEYPKFSDPKGMVGSGYEVSEDGTVGFMGSDGFYLVPNHP